MPFNAGSTILVSASMSCSWGVAHLTSDCSALFLVLHREGKTSKTHCNTQVFQWKNSLLEEWWTPNKFAILESSVTGGSLNFQVELLHKRVGTCCLLLRFVYVVMEREDWENWPIQGLSSCQKFQQHNTKAVHITSHGVKSRHGILRCTISKWSQHLCRHLVSHPTGSLSISASRN
jgi:hypothetical protein